MVYEDGRSFSEGKTSGMAMGFGSDGSTIVGSTSGTIRRISQTELSSRCSPPIRPEKEGGRLFAPLVVAILMAGSASFKYLIYGMNGSRSVIGSVIAIFFVFLSICGVVLQVGLYKASENENAQKMKKYWQRLLEYDRTRICTRCGTLYVP